MKWAPVRWWVRFPMSWPLTQDSLWVGTGEGLCEVSWQTIDEADSWNCWRFGATATLPKEGVDIYSSFLAADPAKRLTEESVEVLWAHQSFRAGDGDNPGMRYEVAYEPGFETQLITQRWISSP